MKAHEETWTANRGVVSCDGAIVANCNRYDRPPSAETDGARARLAACAPEAIRMLLDKEWAEDREGFEYCPSCWKQRYEGHVTDCPWLALMRKAGVRE